MTPITTPLEILLNDYSNEKTRVKLNIDPVLDDGSNWPDLFTDIPSVMSALSGAVSSVSMLNEWSITAPIHVAEGSKTTPADQHAQREDIIVWTYKDTVTNILYRFNTPGPVDDLTKENSDEIDMTNILVAAFATAFDLNCRSPEGNVATLLYGRKTGKRS